MSLAELRGRSAKAHEEQGRIVVALRAELVAAERRVALLREQLVDEEVALERLARAARNASRPRYVMPSERAMFDHRGLPIGPVDVLPAVVEPSLLPGVGSAGI